MDKDVNKEEQKFAEAEADWNNVKDIIPTFKSSNGQPIGQFEVKPNHPDLTPLITVDQVLEDFKNQDLTEQLVEAEQDLSGKNRNPPIKIRVIESLRCLKIRDSFSSTLEEEKKFIFAIAKCKLNISLPNHYFHTDQFCIHGGSKFESWLIHLRSLNGRFLIHH